MSTAPRSTPAKFQIRSLLWSVYAPSFLLTFGQGILIPILPIYARDVFGSSDVLIALMIFFPWLLEVLTTYTTHMFQLLPQVVR